MLNLKKNTLEKEQTSANQHFFGFQPLVFGGVCLGPVLPNLSLGLTGYLRIASILLLFQIA